MTRKDFLLNNRRRTHRLQRNPTRIPTQPPQTPTRKRTLPGPADDTDDLTSHVLLPRPLASRPTHQKARVGLEAVSIDFPGWDSHFTQSTIMNPLIKQLGTGHPFCTDLGPAALAQTTIVVMTEFGRRVQENSSFGADHGRGSAMMVIGGGVRGGRTIGKWPGLSADFLTGPAIDR